MNGDRKRTLLLVLGLAAIFVWTYLPVLTEMVSAWHSHPDYSHGFFVIPMALILAWHRRDQFPRHVRPSWAGVPLLVLGLLIELTGRLLDVAPLRHGSLILSLAGVVWTVGGRHMLWWAAAPIGYLIFMVPLPYRIAVVHASELQRLAATGAVYLLQTLGIPAIALGNIVELERESLEVAYACSGLQMTVAFLAVTSAMALLSSFHWTGKVAIIVTGIPIAISCNILRITATGLAFQWFEAARVRTFFHDLGGFVLIPLAVGMVFAEIYLFERCFPRLQHRGDSARMGSE